MADSKVGNETKANMAGANSSVVNTESLVKAVQHLTNDHANGVKHMPLHGMKTC